MGKYLICIYYKNEISETVFSDTEEEARQIKQVWESAKNCKFTVELYELTYKMID